MLTINLKQGNDAFVVQPEAAALPAVAGAPHLSNSVASLLEEIASVDQHGQPRKTLLPCERPLTIRMAGRDLITLMTLGASPELLVLGFLRNQRIIENAADIESLHVDWNAGVADVELRASAVENSRLGLARATGCGLGSALLGLSPRLSPARLAASTVLRVLEVMRQHDAIHRGAGSVHSCALFRGADLWVAVEDVSRHNGVDTVTGWMAQHGVAGDDKILFTTGRLTAEMVMKAAYSGIPVMLSRNGTTAKGQEIASQNGMILIGRAANRKFLCYVGCERLAFDL